MGPQHPDPRIPFEGVGILEEKGGHVMHATIRSSCPTGPLDVPGHAADGTARSFYVGGLPGRTRPAAGRNRRVIRAVSPHDVIQPTKADFSIQQRSSDILETVNETTQTFFAASSRIAGVSLLVAGAAS